MFGRFSIQEAFMLHKKRKEVDILQHYLGMLAKQMSLFATAKGLDSIKKFRLEYMHKVKNLIN